MINAGVQALLAVQGFDHRVGALYGDGKPAKPRNAGVRHEWKFTCDLRVARVDWRRLVLEVAGQEIPACETVALRVNSTASYRVAECDFVFAKQAEPRFSLTWTGS